MYLEFLLFSIYLSNLLNAQSDISNATIETQQNGKHSIILNLNKSIETTDINISNLKIETVKKFPRFLLNANDLNELIASKNFNETFRLLEVNLDSKLQKDFKKEHIPYATYFDATRGIKPTSLCPIGIPEKDTFQEYVGSLGISNNHSIIIYDRSQLGVFESARVWWHFKIYGHENVSILNGGFRSWKANNLTCSNESLTYAATNFSASFMKKRVRTYEDVVENINTKNELLVDARDKKDFYSINPLNNLTANIPNSINFPFIELYDMNLTRLKDLKQLDLLFKSNSVDLTRALIVSCQKGLKASVLGYVANLLGASRVALYPCSWYEFSQRYKGPNATHVENMEL